MLDKIIGLNRKRRPCPSTERHFPLLPLCFTISKDQNLWLGLYGCETWSLMLRGEHSLKVERSWCRRKYLDLTENKYGRLAKIT
jgi:hypothetical protein